MPSVVQKQTRTFTKPSPDEPGVQIVTVETTETMDDGSTMTTVQTTKKSGALEDFPKDTKKALDESKHKHRHRSRSSSSSSSDGEHGHRRHRHHRRHSRSRSPSPEKKKEKGGFLAKLKRRSKSRSPSPKAASKTHKEKESRRRSTSGSSSDDDDQFEADCIASHNEYRKKHGAPPLERSKQLSKSAKQWAKHLAHDDKMSHNKDSSDGENIYCKWSSNAKHKVKGSEAVDSWYAEIKDHTFGQEPSPGVLKSGHFSQVVWLSSKHVGVGKARSKSGRVYVVANYSPAGNFLGDYCDNVPPVGGFPPGHKPRRDKGPRVVKHAGGGKKTSSSDSSSDEEDFAEQCLEAHNKHRKAHGVPPLKLNKKLCKFSKEWAETIAKKDQMEHRPDSKYGENIFCVWSDNPRFHVKGAEAVQSWYNEIKDHTFGQEPGQGVIKSGHFSQVIWRTSKELGIGKAKSKSGKVMVVANYDPPGNFVGEFAKNVPKPL